MNTNIVAVLLVLLYVCQTTEATGGGMGFGDAFALILCAIITVIGVLAGLGKYARRVSSNQF